MILKKLDVMLNSARFTFRRGREFPLSIQTRARACVSGGDGHVVFVSLTAFEASELLKVLSDCPLPTGVPDGV